MTRDPIRVAIPCPMCGDREPSYTNTGLLHAEKVPFGPSDLAKYAWETSCCGQILAGDLLFGHVQREGARIIEETGILRRAFESMSIGAVRVN